MRYWSVDYPTVGATLQVSTKNSISSPQGWPLIKHVRALPGETYSVEKGSIYINQRYIGPVYDQDNEGNRLPQITGTHTVKTGMFLPLSTHITRSFDGRYFGTVELVSIKGKALPVWTY